MTKHPGMIKRYDAPGSPGRLPVLARAAVFCALVFAILAWQLRAGGLTAFDGAITGWARAGSTPGWTFWMIRITGLGSLGFVAALTAFAVLCLFVRREWGEGLGVAVASLSAWLLYSSLKLVFQRPRPDLPHLVPTAGYSFPSGHATATAALFFTLVVVYCRHTRFRAGRALVLAAVSLLVLLVGISRVYLGVHYPSDVVAGWAAGGLVALIIAMLLLLSSRAG